MDDRFLVYKHLYRRDGNTTARNGTPDPAAGRFYLPVFARPMNVNECWAMVLEKAFAKLHGSYSDIREGNPVEGLAVFWPHAASGFSHRLLSSNLEDVWNVLGGWQDREWPLIALSGRSLTGSDAASYEASIPMDGPIQQAMSTAAAAAARRGVIVEGHAFTIMRTKESSLAVDDGGNPLRLIKLRNP